MTHETIIHRIQDLEKDAVPDVAASYYLKHNQKQLQNGNIC